MIGYAIAKDEQETNTQSLDVHIGNDIQTRLLEICVTAYERLADINYSDPDPILYIISAWNDHGTIKVVDLSR